MSDVPKCEHKWRGTDGKDHLCDEYEGHKAKCICDCGERGYAANRPPAKWIPKPFFKRRTAPMNSDHAPTAEEPLERLLVDTQIRVRELEAEVRNLESELAIARDLIATMRAEEVPE